MAVVVFKEEIRAKLKIIIINAMFHPPLFQHSRDCFPQEIGNHGREGIHDLGTNGVFQLCWQHRPGINEGGFIPQPIMNLPFPSPQITAIHGGVFSLVQIVVQKIPCLHKEPLALSYDETGSQDVAFTKEVTCFGVE